MSTHPDPEQLSAYIDGELTGADRDELEQHLTGCSECLATLRGLRATVADMRALPSPVPSEQDLWALRSAIAKARRGPAERYRRWVVGVGSAAAVAAAIVGVLSLNHSKVNTTSANRKTGEAVIPAPLAAAPPNFLVDNTNYNSTSARSLLSSIGHGLPSGAPRTATSSPINGPVAGSLNGTEQKSFSSADQIAYSSRIAGCERDIFSRGSGGARAIAYIVGRYESTPAFFLVYSVVVSGKTKTEMWVVQQSDCYIRLVLTPQ